MTEEKYVEGGKKRELYRMKKRKGVWAKVWPKYRGLVINRMPPFRKMCKETFRNTMRADLTISYDAGAASESHFIVLNDLGDPGSGESANKYCGFDQMNAIYKNCLVHGVKIRAFFMNATAEPIWLAAYPWADGQDVPTGATNARAGSSVLHLIPDSATAGSFLSRNPVPVFTGSYKLPKITNYKHYNNLDDDNNYAMIDGATPTKKVQVYFIATTVGGGNINATSDLRIELWADVTWWGWQSTQDVS